MPYKYVTKPVPFPKAFAQTDDAAVLSQAASLLLLGVRLQGDRRRLSGIPGRDIDAFRVPRLRSKGGRIRADQVERSLNLKALGEDREPLPVKTFEKLAMTLNRKQSVLEAAKLMEACLRHPHDVVKAAAAVSYFEVTSEPSRLVQVLVRSTYSTDVLVRDFAAAALARLAPEDRRLLELTKSGTTTTHNHSSHTSLLIHGTLAQSEGWWQPGGSFHAYLLNENIRPDLYVGNDRFEWSGGYSDAARAIAAKELKDWTNSRNINRPYLLTHSHGGNVAKMSYGIIV